LQEERELALYYFHLRDGRDRILDREGVEFEGIEAIKDAALQEARAIIAADAREGRIDLRQRIEVEDASGKLIFQLRLADAVSIERD
jgi:uncharacterized protein DUF6894